MGFECLSLKLLSSLSVIRLIFWARSELLVRATVAEEQLKQLQKHLKETKLLCTDVYSFSAFIMFKLKKLEPTFWFMPKEMTEDYQMQILNLKLKSKGGCDLSLLRVFPSVGMCIEPETNSFSDPGSEHRSWFQFVAKGPA